MVPGPTLHSEELEETQLIYYVACNEGPPILTYSVCEYLSSCLAATMNPRTNPKGTTHEDKMQSRPIFWPHLLPPVIRDPKSGQDRFVAGWSFQARKMTGAKKRSLLLGDVSCQCIDRFSPCDPPPRAADLETSCLCVRVLFLVIA